MSAFDESAAHQPTTDQPSQLSPPHALDPRESLTAWQIRQAADDLANMTIGHRHDAMIPTGEVARRLRHYGIPLDVVTGPTASAAAAPAGWIVLAHLPKGIAATAFVFADEVTATQVRDTIGPTSPFGAMSAPLASPGDAAALLDAVRAAQFAQAEADAANRAHTEALGQVAEHLGRPISRKSGSPPAPPTPPDREPQPRQALVPARDRGYDPAQARRCD
jgi:hypothetical protein